MPCTGPWNSSKHRICHSPVKVEMAESIWRHLCLCSLLLVRGLVTEPVGTTTSGIAGRGEDSSREDPWKVFARYAHLSVFPRTSHNPGSKMPARDCSIFQLMGTARGCFFT